ncbi:hypothetical protein ACGFMM_16045 [Streptomyces sp. NPDC048604]|uniref:hypothetical protein n=1 Tax=Streptomyces sp. NPDC048604 TaxID=3365578 RepID=UPI00371A445F
MSEDEALDRLRVLAVERLAYEFVGSDRLIRAALDALLVGVDSPSLARLAGLTRREEPEASGLFESVVDELALRDGLPTDQGDAAWWIVRRALVQIVDGTVDPVEGADRVWDLARPGHWFDRTVSPVVQGLITAYDVNDDEPARLEAAREEIRAAARTVLALPEPPKA